ncbi:tetratricopeptide repeat protein [Bacterioplanoides sp.]|uniref:tetratricopeptide repeat protein n=1 Tax=Bacterioplanoides sp. TaxID=2066072 RepID=UPI003AFF8CF5
MKLLVKRVSAIALMMAMVFLAACSAPQNKPQAPQDYEVNTASLPTLKSGASGSGYSARDLELSALTDGHHHPAIAALFAQAEQARQKHQWRNALKYLDQARQIEPRNPAVLYRQAWVNLKLGKPSQAEQLLLRAKVFTRDNDLNRRLDWLLADALSRQGRGGEAKAARSRATR